MGKTAPPVLPQLLPGSGVNISGEVDMGVAVRMWARAAAMEPIPAEDPPELKLAAKSGPPLVGCEPRWV